MGIREFNSQFDNLQHQLMGLAYKLTNNREDAKDLIQETAMRAFTHRDKFEMGTNFHAWLATIMRNTFINIYRKKRYRNTTTAPTGSHLFEQAHQTAPNQGPSLLTIGELESLVNQLKPIYSRPFKMFVEGYKYEEIAETLNPPMGTVKSRIHCARQQLSKAAHLYRA
ncbi:MAG TPA: RNA polymerase sigma factor [Phaeodactylibacter sp.]|nr:RNA polymerase sigma factor [Phaeodactylibacter sp.]